MRIGIIVAMDSELESIKSILQDPVKINVYHRQFLKGNYNNHKLIICKGGIGKVNAAHTASLMDMCFDTKWIISTGCAGGLNSYLNIGDIVVGTNYCYHDVWCPLTETIKAGELPGIPRKLEWNYKIHKTWDCSKWLRPFKTGNFYTGDQFIQTERVSNEILSKYPENADNGLADICDMESMAIAQVCYQNDMNFIGFRIVSDLPCYHSIAESQMKQYQDFWKSMSDKSYEFLKSFLDSYKGE